jgi:hypothetical protein
MNLSVIRQVSTVIKSCRLWAVAVFVWALHTGLYAQSANKGSLATDTVKLSLTAADTLQKLTADSLVSADSLVNDSLKNQSKEEQLGIKISKDALPAAVTTFAKDSAVLDMKGNMFYLYGDAKANYEEIGIKSGTIIFNQKTNVLAAEPVLDTAGKKISVQEFKQGEELFTYDTLRYNFKSKRAIVRNARSQYGEGFVLSDQVKRNPDESIYGWRNLYTTCNLEHPHFGIRANRIKVVPGRVIASGPANLEIQDVPTPLFLPFGMFPIKQGQRSGFILPTYTLEENRGLGLQRGGYYFAVSDHLGVIAQFDIFSKGSWAMFSTAQYAKRYQYNGSLSVNYVYSKLGEVYEREGRISKDFNVAWSHQVDPKAKPGTSFSASVNFGTSTYNLLNGMTVENILNNQYTSSISYGKTWVGKPYSLNVSLRHNQSTQTGQVTVGLPEINFNLGQFSPFQRRVMVGAPRWYEKITASYSVSVINRWNFYDSLFSLKNIAFNDFDNGIKHTASVQANYNVLRYFNWNISVPYNEYWNTKQLFLNYNSTTKKDDSISRTGFFATRDFNINTSLSTRIYGMKLFKKGKVAGLRHVITPNISASYQPGFAFSPFGYMYETYDINGYRTFRSPYQYTPISGPTNAENNGSIGFSLNNNLQMKVRTKDSTGTKIISLIDGFSIGGSYNLFADSFQMSNINMSFRTSILGIMNISASAIFDPYRYEGTRRTAKYLVETGGGIADFANGNVSLGMSFQGDKKADKGREDAEQNNGEVKRLLQNGGYEDYYDFNIPWNLTINAGVNVLRNRRTDAADTIIYRPILTFNGGFNLTERWKVNVTSGLEFPRADQPKLGLTQIDISRDLHCWQMSLNLIPFGFLRSFHFTLQVKASVLQDLKLTRRKAYQDNF